MFTRIRPPNTLKGTVESVARVIRARLLGPGDKLPSERALAHQLGVSRSTLREGLRFLCKTGYLEVRSGRNGGAFVARWPGKPARHEALVACNPEHLRAQLDLRRALEPAAAELAATRASLIDVAELEGRYYRMVGMERTFDLYRARDARFHIGIAEIAQSPLLLQAITEVQIALAPVLDFIAYGSEHLLYHSNVDHGRVLEAIRQRQPEQARQLMLAHLLSTEKLVAACVRWPSLQLPPAPAMLASQAPIGTKTHHKASR